MITVKQAKRIPSALAVLMVLGTTHSWATTNSTSPPILREAIPYNYSFTSVSQIVLAFNKARRQEEIQLGLPVNQLGKLRLPTQVVWDNMSDDAKALYLINAERIARANPALGILGLPLAGVESHVDAVSKIYTDLLINTNTIGDFQPSGDPSIDNAHKRIDAYVGYQCREFISIDPENLSYYSMSAPFVLSEKSWPGIIEHIIYNNLYNDEWQKWVNRQALLLQSSTLSFTGSQLQGFTNNSGSSVHEGFLGFQKSGSPNYWPFGSAPTYPYKFATIVMWDIFDPVDDITAIENGCNYNITVKTENLPPPSENLPPMAMYDSVTVVANSKNVIKVLANDEDPDGDAITLVDIAYTPTKGSAQVSGDSVIYSAPSNYTGNDYFSYRVSDTKGNITSGSVSVNIEQVTSVNQPPKAVNDTATTTAGKAVTISNVLANDTDPDGNTLTVTANTNPANGTVTRSGSSFTYTPKAGFTGTDTFTYTISDGKGGTATGTVTITVTAANQPPKAVNDTATTTAGKAVTISNVLANDTDPDGNTLTVTANTNPANGTVTRSGSSFTYTPKAGFTGTDTFTYTISDGKGGTATGTVTITVTAANQPPKAVNDTVTTTAGKAVTISNVLANDTDPDGNTLKVTANTNPAHGTVTRSGSSFTYTPKAGFTGTDTFTYTISDGKGGTATGTVTITVTAVNQPPKAVNDTATTTAGKAVTISNVLANDTDPDGNTLTVTANTNPANGTVTRSGSSFTYTPKAGFTGTDTFTYAVSDGKGGTATGTVTITVTAANQPPKAVPDAGANYRNLPIVLSVLANDSDLEGKPLTITSFTKPLHGTVTQQGANLVYTSNPTEAYSGLDSFKYTISDGNGGMATTVVNLYIFAPVQ